MKTLSESGQTEESEVPFDTSLVDKWARTPGKLSESEKAALETMLQANGFGFDNIGRRVALARLLS